jgi:hypothetical protein
MPEKWPGPTYEAHAEFRAPMDFVFRWCTDYTPEDSKLEKEAYQRRILRRSPREVVYEDLDDTPDGWFWAHHVVRLHPPDRWHSDSVGSHRLYSLDYRLTPLSGNRTRLTLRARRRRYGVGGKNPSVRTWKRHTETLWKNFARELERDYRKARRAGR